MQCVQSYAHDVKSYSKPRDQSLPWSFVNASLCSDANIVQTLSYL